MKSHSTAQLSPRKMCFAHLHMTIAEYGLYSHLREVSSKQTPPFTYRFDDRTISGRFSPERGTSKDAVNRLRQSLVRKGFIIWLEPKKKRAGGKFIPLLGRIISHQEWALSNPGKCCETSQEMFTAENSPVSDSQTHQSHFPDSQSHFLDCQSQDGALPVAFEASHRSRQRDVIGITKPIAKTESTTGIALPSNFEKIPLDLAGQNVPESHLGPPVASARPTGKSVSSARQADTANRIAAILGMTRHGPLAGWVSVVERFSHNDNPAFVEDVLQRYVNTQGERYVRDYGPQGFVDSYDALAEKLTQELIKTSTAPRPLPSEAA